jgi:hypothetical protein
MAARSALLIATTQAADPALRPLAATETDAHELAAVLQDPDIAGFDVSVIVDEPAQRALERIEAFFADGRPDDLQLFYFTGQGVLDENGNLYFVMRDTRMDRLASTALAATLVRSLSDQSRSRHVLLLLDCSFSGAIVRSQM